MSEQIGDKRKLKDESEFPSVSIGDEGKVIQVLPKRPVIVPTQKPNLHYTPLKTGICYDVRMRYHAKIFTSYFEYIDPHPEDPRRIYRIYKILAENGLINDPSLTGVSDIGDLMLKIPVREATKEEILDVHTEEHMQFLESTEKMTREELLSKTEKGDSVYLNNDSYISARLSCGGAIEACKAVVEGRVKNALAIVRPPGHHAEPQAAGGFCLFSNVSVAAKSILKTYPESVRKILIVDWDIHHGNGTQKAFYEDDNVLYISLHRFELGKFYPGFPEGNYDKVGDGKGKGFNCNITWPVKGVGDVEYIWAFEQIVIPMAREFRPDLVIVSSGFDAAHGDTIGQCHVTPNCYGYMTHMLKSLARGNLCVVLEGGYNLDSISNSALAVAKILIGEPPDEIPESDRDPKPGVLEMINKVIRVQSKYWKCFRRKFGNFGGEYENAIESQIPKMFPLQDAIRNAQLSHYYDDFGMISLSLPNLNLPKNSIICSSNFFKAKSLCVLLHDTPEVWGNRDIITGIIDPSTSIIFDSSLKFINWAIERETAVIDINIPRSAFEADNYSSNLLSQDVMISLWDNHFKYIESLEKLCFIGIGEATSGIVHLLGKRDTRTVTKAAINFVGSSSLKPIVPSLDESLGDWYFKNSLVFTDHFHGCWSENDKKPRKKYGRVLRCDTDGIHNIIEERFEEATDFILDAFDEWSDTEDE
ncbi:hypothetical protein TPHA_0C03390 [Tetrapisispora phaffii CBS 4417]|uniref:Histone deacetylase n=1 Tax=Tetrapisispora phaffii (strain ATCC 24235 / CBS 4417 / NBRC 1672 / NRRL Y-8282 / UCD 70-5) TaxID=1071381 RepID=G8BRW5_TETPH|nr:hypothetical protein TPHA_0C03390 [Tetrapisispora phaffii CBS 4417]CCE62491.1 hypothetical protein TPHA_0C03390 [Tetrapisispora phaffii CBS 4417]